MSQRIRTSFRCRHPTSRRIQRQNRRLPHDLVMAEDGGLRRCLGAGGGAPLQHLLATDEGAVQRPADRVGHAAGGIRQKHNAQGDLGIGVADIGPDLNVDGERILAKKSWEGRVEEMLGKP